jgi:Na+-transporting methylmalonyl-CoA/oxaloacetate decarboxylase gamma subunit
MINRLKTLSPMTKVWFVLSLLVLILWVIPNMVSFYKNESLYKQKATELNELDKRENSQLDAKSFHSEVFKTDAEEQFEKVEVVSISDNRYRVTILLLKESLSKFHNFLKNISLNYQISVEDTVIYEEVDKHMRVIIVVKPF